MNNDQSWKNNLKHINLIHYTYLLYHFTNAITLHPMMIEDQNISHMIENFTPAQKAESKKSKTINPNAKKPNFKNWKNKTPNAKKPNFKRPNANYSTLIIREILLSISFCWGNHGHLIGCHNILTYFLVLLHWLRLNRYPAVHKPSTMWPGSPRYVWRTSYSFKLFACRRFLPLHAHHCFQLAIYVYMDLKKKIPKR